MANPRQFNWDKSTSGFNRANTISVNSVYMLPFKKNILVGGWQVSGIFTFTTGAPLNVTTGVNQARGPQNATLRPDYIPGCNWHVGSPTMWYNPNCFTLPPVGIIGNPGRFTLIGPGLVNQDFSVMKDTAVPKISEQFRIQVRAEFYNIFNHPAFALPTYLNFVSGATVGNRGDQSLGGRDHVHNSRTPPDPVRGESALLVVSLCRGSLTMVRERNSIPTMPEFNTTTYIAALVFAMLAASTPALPQALRDEGTVGNPPPPRAVCCPGSGQLDVGPSLGYVAVPDPLPLPEGMKYGGVAAVGVNSKGHIIVYHRLPVPLIEFDENGKFIRTFGQGLSARPHGMRIDAQDNIWITDVNENTVIKLSPQGETLMTLGTRGPAGDWNEAAGSRHFNQPVDLAIAPNGDVFVAQGHGGPDPRIFRFDKSGKVITRWSGRVAGPAAFAFPHAIALSPQGDVYVGDRMAMHIQVFDHNGKYKRTIQKANLVCGFYVGKDKQLYMTSGFDGQIEKLDWNTGRIFGIAGGGPGKGLGQFGEAHYMTMDAKGDMYVADTMNNSVQKFEKQH